MAVHTRDHILLHQGNNTVELETVDGSVNASSCFGGGGYQGQLDEGRIAQSNG
jgi:hypothetical protein